MTSSPRRFTARISHIGGFYIFAGPCESCTSTVEPWIKQFCSMPEHKWYAQIDRDWAADWFNNYGMKEQFANYELALEMISDKHSDDWASLSDQHLYTVLSQAKQLYGLLHARWITQNRGLAQMRKKYDHGIFGVCPRSACNSEKLLPMGTTNTPRHHSVKLFCPQCCDIYVAPTGMKFDGAHFGPAFPHIFLSEYTDLDSRKKFKPTVLKAFGFELHKSVRNYNPHSTNHHASEYLE